MYEVVKRDGKVVDFSISKITGAITKAFETLKQFFATWSPNSNLFL